jgi:3-dehydroquinate dehydratase-2
MAKRKVLLVQGPNLSYLGKRQPEIYGTTTAKELDAMVTAHAAKQDCALSIFYTHIEGEAIGRIYEALEEGIDGLLMNPAAFIYNAYALRDTLRTLPVPYVEVHISNIEKRGIPTILAAEAVGMICGFGMHGYRLGLDALLEVIESKAAKK